MLRSVWMWVVSVVLLSGCAATSMIVGVHEPNLSRIQPTDQRSQVEKTLGERLWRAGSADGLTYEIYQYEEARPAHPILGTIGLGLDVLSFGVLEAEAGDARQLFAPVKQVAVTYDDQDRVVSLSRPWSVDAVGPCRRMRSLLPADSGVPPTAQPAPRADRTASASRVATLKFAWLDRGFVMSIDGRKPEARVLELAAGLHKVNDAAVELLPGRLYRMKSDLFIPQPGESVTIVWIEDTESGETLHCWERSA
jgi:hypothetical protein